VVECEQLALDPYVPQRGFSRAIRTTKSGDDVLNPVAVRSGSDKWLFVSERGAPL
jgi:hypothetical protein